MRSSEPLALVICASLAVACSSQSQNARPAVVAQVPAAAGTSAAPAAMVAGTASAGAVAAVAAAPAGSAVDSSLAKVDPDLIKEGYRVVRRQGKILYCQTQTVTGTKFGSTVCATAEQIHESERETELSKRQLIRTGPGYCVGTQCAK
jgi:hypothetical protein